MGMLDDLLGAALGGQGLGGGAPARGGPGLPAGLGGGAMATLLPILLSMLSQGGGRSPGGLGGLLGQVLGGGGGLGGPSGSAGGLGGLGGLLEQLERTGHGAHAQSWVGTGQNLPISPDAIGQVFGQDGLAQIARRAGLSTGEAGAGLAQLLPALVDHVTPQGKVPAGNEIDDVLAGLMQRLGG